MNERTANYMKGRFSDYYRKNPLVLPPEQKKREWGFIPFTSNGKTFMKRHISQEEIGDIGGYLEFQTPRHAYHSAGYYEYPGASTMDDKEWTSSDLIFDLDADHLDGVNYQDFTYAQMLDLVKDSFVRLLNLLEQDFEFEDMQLVFSGGRGYHVHIRDSHIQDLRQQQRVQIVDYVKGSGFDIEAAYPEFVEGTPLSNRLRPFVGGWSQRVYMELLRFIDELESMNPEEAVKKLSSDEFHGIGETKAKELRSTLIEKRQLIESGNIRGMKHMNLFLPSFSERVIEEYSSQVDEPVTTDIKRLIRLPGSLHGKTGMMVTPVTQDEIESFDPLVDAIPELFTITEIDIEVTRDSTSFLMRDELALTEGVHTVPEYVGLYMMGQGWAEIA